MESHKDVQEVEDTSKVDTTQASTTEEDEDASHKRKFANDDERRSDVSPARKKHFIKPDDHVVEDDPTTKGISKFGLEGIAAGDYPIQDAIDCPSGMIGRLIGKQGETIKYLQGETNTKLQIDHQAQGEVKKVCISGSSLEAVRRAKRLIQEVLDSDVAPIVPGEVMDTLDCPQGIVGRVIGRRGETIRALQTASGAKIIVEQNFPEGVPRKVKMSGKPDVVALAVKMVSELISGEPGSAIGVINKYTTHATASRVVECPKSMVGRVIGKGGETIKTIQATTGAVVQIQQDSDPCFVTISGTHPAVEYASSIVEEIARGGAPFRSTPPYYGDPLKFVKIQKKYVCAGMPRPPSMNEFGPYPHPSYAPVAHHPSGSFGGPGGSYNPYVGNYGPQTPNYGYYPSMPNGAYPQHLHPASPHVPAPPPTAHPYGYASHAQQPGTPYGSPQIYSQGSGTYSQGVGPSEHYHQGPMPPMADGGRSVASHWTELNDVEGRLYYYNAQTGTSQWEKPSDFQ